MSNLDQDPPPVLAVIAGRLFAAPVGMLASSAVLADQDPAGDAPKSSGSDAYFPEWGQSSPDPDRFPATHTRSGTGTVSPARVDHPSVHRLRSQH